MKIILLGCDGQLGKDLKRHLSFIGNVEAFSRLTLDVTHHTDVEDNIRRIQPDIIVNAAAYTSVDEAETCMEHADAVNSLALENLAQVAKSENAWLIHYSTDYVFDGNKPAPYLETDPPNPINVYGASKLSGELAIARINCKNIIFRTTWVIGKDGNNFVKTILRLASERNRLNVINDQLGVPTSCYLISKVTIDAISAIKNDEAWEQGVYHLSPKGVSNWHEVAQLILKYAEQQNVKLSAGAEDIYAISTDEYPAAAKRPKNSLLDTKKLRKRLSFDLPFWKDDFLDVVDDIIRELGAS